MDEERVVKTYTDMIYGIAWHYAGNAVDADDIYSETFLAYFKKERIFESEEHRKAWLIRTTINAAKTLLGGRRSYEELNEETAGEAPGGCSPDLRMDLQAAIARLPEAQREVLLLFYWQDLSVREIAETLGKSESGVKVTLFRARERLRAYFEEES